MKCPHCLVFIHVGRPHIQFLGHEPIELGGHPFYWTKTMTCPNCQKLIVWLSSSTSKSGSSGPGPERPIGIQTDTLVRPRGTNRPPVPPEVDEEFAADYKEACLILADSPNASAALSRRCLQLLLRGKGGVNHGTLYQEIQEVLNSGKLPPGLAEVIEVVRKVGNAAAHPMHNNAGVITPVDEWEAEWCLEVLEALFDHYFVAPARNQERLNRLSR